FSGQLGLSVVDKAAAWFENDYVADSQFAGSTVRTTADGPTGAAPMARFHGVALVCNRHENLTGTCTLPTSDGVEMPCTTVQDCCTKPDETIDDACVA